MERIIQASRETGTLNLTGKSLSALPPSIWIANAASDGDGPKWWELCPLTKLVAGHNEIEDVPLEMFEALTDLAILDLNHNQIPILHPSIQNLSELKLLDLSHNMIKQLPDEMCYLPQLVKLSLNNNELTSLPFDMGQLKSLEVLNISGNFVVELPKSIGALSSLIEFNCSDNKLSTLPLEMGHLERLTSVDASKNTIKSLPASIAAKWKQLKHINLRENRIGSLPPSFSELSQLSDAYLGVNRMTSIHQDVCKGWANLHYLDVSQNLLSSVPHLPLIKSLTRLDLANNKLTQLPPELGTLKLNKIVLDGNPLRSIRRELLEGPASHLLEFLRSRMEEKPHNPLDDVATMVRTAAATKQLELVGLGLQQLPEEIFALTELEKLSCEKNNLTQLPHAISNFRSLSHLTLTRNKLSTVPPECIHMSMSKTLVSLNLDFNNLTEVPHCLMSLIALQSLNISHNPILGKAVTSATTFPPNLKELFMEGCQLRMLPDCVLVMDRLTTLRVPNNALKSVPVELVRLPIEHLDLQNNDITTIPPEFGEWETLKALLVEGNPLKAIRQTVIQKGTNAIKEFLKMRIVRLGG